MTDERDFPSILQDAARQLGLTVPDADEFGVCSVGLDDGFYLSIICPPFSEFAFLATPISILDHLDRKSLYRRALESNYMLSATRGATLAIDPQANQLLVCSRLRLESLTADVLGEEISAIVAGARNLRETLLAEPVAGDPGNPGDAPHNYITA
jgi:hypothetical protein